MFDVGFAELFLLSLIGLLVLGPERLPAVARTIGGFVRKARLSWYNLKRTVEAELAEAEAANPINEAKREMEAVQKQVADIGKSLDQSIAPAVPDEAETANDAGPTGDDQNEETPNRP